MAKARKSTKVSMGDLFDVISSGRESFVGADQEIRLLVLVDVDAPADLVCAVRDSLVAQKATGIVDVWPLGSEPVMRVTPDAVVVVAGPVEKDVAVAIRQWAGQSVHVGVVASSALDVPDADLPEALSAFVSPVAACDASALPTKLAEFLARALGDKNVALASCFPFARKTVISALTQRCAVENAAVGAVSLIPGSDFPIMTCNQAKLALDIAGAYGRGVSPVRAAELAGVVGAGILYRGVARCVAGLLPGVGWALKSGIGYAGTLATSRAVQARFDIEDCAKDKEKNEGTGVASSAQAPVAKLPVAQDEGYLVIGSDCAGCR